MKFVRGDTFKFKFKLKTNEEITDEDIDTILISCKKNVFDEEYVFQKTLEDIEKVEDYYYVTFESSDTENLDLGRYFFDIEVTLTDGYRKTKVYEFYLTQEITRHQEVPPEEGEENG